MNANNIKFVTTQMRFTANGISCISVKEGNVNIYYVYIAIYGLARKIKQIRAERTTYIFTYIESRRLCNKILRRRTPQVCGQFVRFVLTCVAVVLLPFFWLRTS